MQGLSSFCYYGHSSRRIKYYNNYVVNEDELKDIRKMWNTHLIMNSRYSGGVTGISNELFYVPSIQGFLS